LLESFDARLIRGLLASLLLLPPTLSKTTLMEMKKKGGWNGVHWVSQMSTYTSIIKAKTRKTRKKMKRHEENRTTRNITRTHGRAPPTTGRGGPHGQPVVGSVHYGPFFPALLRFVLLWCFDLGRGFCLCWVILGLLCKLPLSSRPSTSFFLQLLGSSHVNLQSKPKQA